MTPTLVALYILAHGCTCEPPLLFGRFARHDACARTAVLVEAEARKRFGYPDAVAYCHTTGAPLAMFRAPAAPWREGAE